MTKTHKSIILAYENLSDTTVQVKILMLPNIPDNTILILFHRNRDVKLKHACYLNASLSCSNKLKFSLDVAWNFTEALIAGVCIEAVIPICNPVKARGCILDLWTQVDLVKDFQAACKYVQMNCSSNLSSL